MVRVLGVLAVAGFSYGAAVGVLVWLLRDFPESWS